MAPAQRSKPEYQKKTGIQHIRREEMPSKQEVEESLSQILIPGITRNLLQMNLVRDITIDDGNVKVTLATTAVPDKTQDWLKDKIAGMVGELADVHAVTTDFVSAAPKDLNQIERIIAVMSGKGGVGKSLVAGLLAADLARRGNDVGILDADITGPSIPKMFGLTNHPIGSDTGIMPLPSTQGIGIMSMNLLLPSEDEAVIWRGPLMSKALTQFWEEVLWGKLDYRVIDLPPGTGDAALTIMQTVPLTGVVEVFTSQDLTTMVVRKAIKMAQKMNIRVLGVIENMSYLLIPETGKKINVFGKSKGEEMAQASNSPLLGQIPIDPKIADLCDQGKIENYESDVVSSIVANMLTVLDKKGES